MTPAYGADTAAKPHPDVLVLLDGERLIGELDHVADGKVYFKSKDLGKVEVKWDKLQELHTETSFAVIEKGVPVGRKKANLQIPVGKLELDDGKVTVETARGPQKIPVSNIADAVTQLEFERNVNRPQGVLRGVTGTISAGLSEVSATQNSVSINTGVDLVRVAPVVAWMPPSRRTLLSFASTYGRITQPNTPAVTTNILRGKVEEDQYFTRRLYALEQAKFDHNVSQGLDLQQLYGLGVGVTPFKDSVQQLDLMWVMNYTRQELTASGTTPAMTRDLIGSSFGDNYIRKLPRKIVLTQTASYIPAWNSPEDYSAHVMVNATFPITKNFGLSTQVVDDYLNNPVVGFQGNSFQFSTALTYTIQ